MASRLKVVMLFLAIFVIAHFVHAGKNKAEQVNKALLVASEKGQEDKVRQLITANADVEARDEDGWTPLHQTARNGYKAVAEMLLAVKANVDATAGGWTPLHVAAVKGHSAVAEVLLAAKANVDATDLDGPEILASEPHKLI